MAGKAVPDRAASKAPAAAPALLLNKEYKNRSPGLDHQADILW